MALKSWSISSFPGATSEAPVELAVLQAPFGKVVITLSLLVSNYGETGASITVRRKDGSTEKFKWLLAIPAGNSPFAFDSKIVLQGGDILSVESTSPDVAVDLNGNEDIFLEEEIDSRIWKRAADAELVVPPVPTVTVTTLVA